MYQLQQEMETIPTGQLAQTLNVAPSSVTDMIKRLSGMKPRENGVAHIPEIPEPLLDYRPYHGVRLNEAGMRVALSIIRRHRLIEMFLFKILGYTWDEVHEEADLLEHAISHRLEARIAASLGHPERDPHGDPIPALNGSIPAVELIPLCDLAVGECAVITRIVEQSSQTLHQMSALELLPGTPVCLQIHFPLNDTLTLLIGEDQESQIISQQIASKVMVRPTHNLL
jgi:DtxR family Mn-dependent transcriptional regulator